MTNERSELNKNLAQMLKGGVIMDVTTPEQAKIAERAGVVAVMALERIPADIRAAGGVSRMIMCQTSEPMRLRVYFLVSWLIFYGCFDYRVNYFFDTAKLQLSSLPLK